MAVKRKPRCVELARVLKKTGGFYYHCDWHASHYVPRWINRRGDEELRSQTPSPTIAS